MRLVNNKNFKWGITAKRVILSVVSVFIAGLAVKYGDSQWYMALAPVLVGLENFVSHR